MRSGILRTYCATLRLRADAPFPSQLKRPGKWLRLRVVTTAARNVRQTATQPIDS